MKLKDFDYPLPEELIAMRPLVHREDARMMVIHRQTGLIEDRSFRDLHEYFVDGDGIFLNQSKVLHARLEGIRPSGGKVECFFLRKKNDSMMECLVKTSAKKENLIFTIGDTVECKILSKADQNGVFDVQFNFSNDENIETVLQKFGQIPLPPYIARRPELADLHRYQTVFSKIAGSVAAPTAGLHFTNNALDRLREIGVTTHFVTLHVGLGTFQPIKNENIIDHCMHKEFFSASGDAMMAMKEIRERKNKVLAVGTTTVRVLETYARKCDRLGEKLNGWTDLFLYPGCEFKVVDSVLTNFHQPKSSLIVLLAAFMGKELLEKSYALAINKKYRFLSYGDCMLVL